ncbi:hypothetical protein BS17DRAFT_741410 [Gyrodon lividus]|nr:hypothetical protein BS17DRAFT_741410 [Gyrodon lividus]
MKANRGGKVRVISPSVRHPVVQMYICRMGNKVLLTIFRLTFDNGTKLVVEILRPLSAPRRLCTASEVATMYYARNILGILVPRVLSWNADADAFEVGIEYILMEHAQGVELYQRREKFREAAMHSVAQLINIECKFARRRPSQIGSLYYKEDGDGSDRFQIGPYVDWNIWRGKRNDGPADRGPWPDALSYIAALIDIEKKRLSKFAIPRGPWDVFRRSSSKNSPEAHIHMLDDSLAVLPSILPQADLCVPVLWYIDLYVVNIFVALGDQPGILGLIDWQGIAAVSESIVCCLPTIRG